jgi:hypothetical protein
VLLGNLGLGEVVLLGKLQVLQELGIAALHAHVARGAGLPGSIPVGLPVLVVVGVVLGLGHCRLSCRSESSNISLVVLDFILTYICTRSV